MFIVYIEQRVLKIKSYKKLGLFFIPYSRLPIHSFIGLTVLVLNISI